MPALLGPHLLISESGGERMKCAPCLEVWSDHELYESLQGSRKWKSPAKFERSDAQHCSKMPPKALGRRVLQAIGNICHRETGCLEEKGRMEEAHGGQVVLGRGESSPGKPGHQGARPHIQSL